MDIKPFTVGLRPAVLDDLRERLENTRWPDEVSGAGWDYGTNLGFMRSLIDYWHEDFDWPAQERALNALPHFLAEIDGQDIHFIHARGRGPKPLPIIITHGWPSSFVEMLKLIPLLAVPGAHGGDPADAHAGPHINPHACANRSEPLIGARVPGPACRLRPTGGAG